MLGRTTFVFALVASVAAAGTATTVRAAARGLTLGATVSVPSQFRTLGVASGDGAVWATDGTATLTRVDPSSQSVVASIPVPDADLVAAAGGSVWVVSSNSTAYRIDSQTNKIVARIRVAPDPTGIALGGGALWVAGRSGQSISRVSATTGKMIAKVPTPESPRYVAVGAGAVWAASNESPTIWRINPSGKKVVATIPLTDTPNGLVATGNSVFVLGSTNDRIIRINPRTNRVAGYTRIPKSDGFIGYGGAIAADAGSVWVTTLTSLLQLDPRTGHIVASVAVGTHPSHDPVGLTAVSSGPAGLWVGDGDGKAIHAIQHP
jgi:virginiamycin B lyase